MRPEDVHIREVLFEFHRIGNAVRVAAIDPRRNIEVTTVAAVGTPESTMKRVALRKLRYVIAKRLRAAREDNGDRWA